MFGSFKGVAKKRAGHRFFLFMRHTLMVLFLSCITFFGSINVKPAFGVQHFSDRFAYSGYLAEIATQEQEKRQAEEKTKDLERTKKTLSGWLASRYKRIPRSTIENVVDISYKVGKEESLDPVLILAIIELESAFHVNIQSNRGAQGLMQVMTSVHASRFKKYGGVKFAFDPEVNIRVGVEILKFYIKRGGSLQAGLKSYVGAAALSSDGGYSSNISKKYRRLQSVAKVENTAEKESLLAKK